MSSLSGAKRRAEEEPAARAVKRATSAIGLSDRLPVESLVDTIRADAAMQRQLSDEDWEDLDRIRAQYESGEVDKRALVDGLSAIVGGTTKLFGMLKVALCRSSSCGRAEPPPHASPAPVLPLRVALQRVSSMASSTSSASTPGGAEVTSFLGPRARSFPAGRGRVPTAPPPPSSPAVHTLVHSFHCTDDECERPKCRELKLVLERMQDHTEQCPAMRTPLGAPVKDCKTCRLYKALTRTRPGSASARPRRTSPLMSSLR